MKVFVVIVTYRGQQWYQRCFDSLLISEYPLSVIVVDNASGDNTVDFLKVNYPGFKLIESDKNLGFGRANNIGIRHALEEGADYVLLLNQDAWLTATDTIDELLRIHLNNPEYGILSPVHINVERNNIEKLLLNRIDDFRVTDSQLIDDLYFQRLKDVYSTRYVNAASWFISRKTLEIVGGFDPIYFHYGEDDNYLNRIFYHGFKLGICPKLRIVHDNDRVRYLYEEKEDDILRMIEYTNINKSWNINKEIRIWFYKYLISTLKFRKKRSRVCWQHFLFLYQNKKSIIFSNNTNKQIGPNWLY